ncbi:MAG: PHP domain-containing protein [bacterium]|nr:PHP domain-containing protein [bacterium]
MKDRSITLKENLDVHVHTSYSACCEDITLEQLRIQAKENNIVYAVTDHSTHLYFPKELAGSIFREDFKDLLRKYREEGRHKIERYIIEVKESGALSGIELDVYSDGTLIFEEDFWKELDIVIGAVHFLPSIVTRRPKEIIKEFKRCTIALLSSGKVDVLAHPFRILLVENEVLVGEELIEWLVEKAEKYHVGLEINSHRPFEEIDVKMAKLALKRGVPLLKGSDAHRMSEFGNFLYQEKVLNRACL